MVNFTAYILTSVGLTVLVVWPETGPLAWLREHVLRRILPESVSGMLDCYLCFGFWAALVLAPLWWLMDGRLLYFLGCVMTTGIFWMLQRSSGGNDPEQEEAESPPVLPSSSTISNKRQSICHSCPDFKNGTCTACNCCSSTWHRFLSNPNSKCPHGRF
jgi:hypothetical protein